MSENMEVITQAINKEEKLTEKEMFDALKDSVKSVNKDILEVEKNNLMSFSKNLVKTGQKKLAKDVLFVLKVIDKEKELATKTNIDTYVNRDVLFDYIQKVENRAVVMNLIEKYPREIPRDVVLKLEEVKSLGIFTDYLVVFTDYTGEARSQVAEDERERDPILFGIFEEFENNLVYDRLYFIADWEDEFCDLTLDVLVREQKENNIVGEMTGKLSDDEEIKLYKELENLVSDEEPKIEEVIESTPFIDKEPSSVIEEVVQEEEKVGFFKNIFRKLFS